MADLTPKWTSRLSAFEELTHKWKHVGLGALQKTTLDADALLLTANKESLAQGRKTLGGKTKEFAQLPSDRKLTEFGSLLKCYQGYVDELTKFLTEAERCYFNLHGAVQSMVDPFPLMDRFSKERNTILEFVRGYEESEGLRRAVKEREAELQGLHNQEVTIKKLRAQLAETELSAMATAEKTVSNTQEELNSILTQWKVREAELHQDLQRSLTEQRKSEGEIKELGSQLASLRSRYSELEELRDSEASTLASELEEAAIQSRLVQREVDRLRASEKDLKKALASVSPHSGDGLNSAVLTAAGLDTNDINYVSALNQELQQMRDECSNLRVRCSLLEKEVEKAGVGSGAPGSTEGSRSLVTASLAQLQRALDASSDEVNRLSEDGGEKDRLIGSLRSRLETAQSDLIAREAEVTVLKVRVKRLEDEKQPLLAAVRDLERELSGRKKNSTSDGQPIEASVPFDLGSVLNPQRLVLDGAQVQPTLSSEAVPAIGASDEAFFAVTTQRDRLRQRLLALEEAASQEVDQLRTALKAIRDERDELLLQQSHTRETDGPSFGVRIPMHSVGNSQLYSPQLKKGRQVVTALDTLTVLLYKHVLSDVWMRRAFLGYLSMLHIFVFVDLFYQTSGFF